MNTPKHTPGPWRVNDTDACIWPTVGRRAPIATLFTAQDPESEGSPESAHYSPEELQNMALISSAPELLEALQYIASKCATLAGWKLDPEGHEVSIGELLELAEKANAATAKAEGRQ